MVFVPALTFTDFHCTLCSALLLHFLSESQTVHRAEDSFYYLAKKSQLSEDNAVMQSGQKHHFHLPMEMDVS